MSANRVDYLRECNEHSVPLDDFHQQFCVRCFQPECTRSKSGTLKFDQRVSTWLDRLFLNVPKLDIDDPRYNSLANQKFITVDTSRTPEIRGDWIDPENLQPDQTVDIPERSIPVQSSSPVLSSLVIPRRMVLANAPDQSGRILAGPLTKETVRDPWTALEKPSEPVVLPGSRIKLGGSGV